jgi:hypothetical protein
VITVVIQEDRETERWARAVDIPVIGDMVRGVLGNKCAGQHNLKTLHFKETIVLGNFFAMVISNMCFFCSALSTTGRWL